jgi:hypothetical protein
MVNDLKIDSMFFEVSECYYIKRVTVKVSEGNAALERER